MTVRRRGPSGRGITVAWTAAIMCLTVARGVATEVPDILPEGTIGLDEAVETALRHDPALAAYGFETRAREARTRQEGRFLNPTLGTELENVGRFGGKSDDADATQATVTLTQVLELGGQRGKRVEVARQDERLATRDYERARLETAARTRKAFAAGLLAEGRRGLAEAQRALAVESERAVRRQLDAGGGSTIDLARAEAARATAEAAVARRQREAFAARAALAAIWGGSPTSITRLAGTLDPLPRPRTLDELREALAAHPDLARFDDASARAAADVALEEARRVPNVAVRVGARRFVRDDSNALVAEFSLPLPLADRNADAVSEARERLGKLRAERHAAMAATEAVLRAEHGELVAAYEEARTLARDVLPRVRKASRETRRAHAEGRLRLLEVLEAERAITESEDAHLTALARFHTSAAEITRVTGVSAVTPAGEAR